MSTTTTTTSRAQARSARRFVRTRYALRDQGPWVLLTLLVCALVLAPLVPLIFSAFDDGGRGLRTLWETPGLGTVFRDTLLLGLGALVLGMVAGTLLATSMYALSPRVRRFVSFMPILPIMIPSVAHVIGFVFLFSPENGYANTLLRGTPFFGGESGPINVYTPFWIIVYTGVNLASFVYLFVYAGLRNLGPDLALAARVSGAGRLRTWGYVTLPILRPTFLYAGAVCFLLALGQFTGPLILGRREGLEVLTTRMFELTLTYPVDFAAVSALGMPLLVLAIFLVLLQRGLLGNQSRFAAPASSLTSAEPSRSVNVLGTTFIVGFILVSAISPMLALVFVAFSPFWTGSIDFGSLTTHHFSEVLGNPRIVESIFTSLTVSVLAVLIAIPLGLFIALALYNRDRIWAPLSTVLDVASNFPITLPAALLGFGFLFAFSHPSIGIAGTQWAFVIAYITIMIPYSVRYQLATLMSLGQQTTEASRVSGAGPVGTLLTVIIPLSRVGMASSAAIMFVLLIHEFGVSVLLRSPQVNVMSVVLFQQFDTGLFPEVAVLSLLMTGITGIGIAVALAFGGGKALERM